MVKAQALGWNNDIQAMWLRKNEFLDEYWENPSLQMILRLQVFRK